MPNNLATAYSTKRRGARRMADGGMVQSDPIDQAKAKKAEEGMRKAFGGTKETVKPLAFGGMADQCMDCGEMHDSEMGCGMPGESVKTPMEGEEMEHNISSSEMGRFANGGMASSVSESIMAKHKARMMADGGQVDIELNGQEADMGDADADNQEAALKENYDEGMHSMVDRIRRKKMGS